MNETNLLNPDIEVKLNDTLHFDPDAEVKTVDNDIGMKPLEENLVDGFCYRSMIYRKIEFEPFFEGYS